MTPLTRPDRAELCELAEALDAKVERLLEAAVAALGAQGRSPLSRAAVARLREIDAQLGELTALLPAADG